jgi:hypothetical protein
MDNLDNLTVWRQIPPEEKLILVSTAHARGVAWALGVITVAAIVSVGLHMNWIFWGGLALSPLIFQFVTGKTWRDLRPRMILEYLAARSAARRYAFSANSKDLNLVLLFRGTLEETLQNLDETQAYLESLNEVARVPVWVALFNDAVVLMSEEPGGAQARFASVLDDKFRLESEPQDGRSDYSRRMAIYLGYNRGQSGDRRVKLTSNFPAAMVVFEKKTRQLQAEVLERLERDRQAFSAVLEDMGGNDFTSVSFR